MYGSNGIALELFDGVGQLGHVVIIDERELIEPGDIVLGGWGEEFPARLTQHRYRIMVVIVSDLALCLVQCLPNHILRHVYSRRVRILCLYCVLPISPDFCS